MTRFFIGKDIREARAFGIYQKLKGEIAARKSQSATRRYYENTSEASRNNTAKTKVVMIGVWGVCFLAAVFGSIFMGLKSDGPSRGYYQYEDDIYYYQSSSWYYYDEVEDGWSYINESEVPADLSSDSVIYRTYNHNGQRFEDSIWYIEETYSDSDDYDDWDNEYDWDSGDSWDSGGSDWDSDW